MQGHRAAEERNVDTAFSKDKSMTKICSVSPLLPSPDENKTKDNYIANKIIKKHYYLSIDFEYKCLLNS